MKKEIIVISLGGSLIVPNKIDSEFLKNFKKTILKNTKKYKFVIVCGGGSIARTYINGLESIKKKKEYLQGQLGISTTRLNAKFMTHFFEGKSNKEIPKNFKEIENSLRINKIVFCGALRYAENETSDSTSVKLANYLDTTFINLTNVKGLYEKNPKRFRAAKFIPEISHENFLKITKKMKFKPGQHFVLDQTSAKLIKRHNIKTYILGQDLKNLDNLLNKKHFVGTKIGI